MSVKNTDTNSRINLNDSLESEINCEIYSEEKDSIDHDTSFIRLKHIFELDSINPYVNSNIIDFELEPCPYTIESAKKRIKDKYVSLVIHCAFLGCPDMDKGKRDRFMKKYKVEFEYLGCMISWDRKDEDTEGYNETMFRHLVQKYGEIVKADYEDIFIE